MKPYRLTACLCLAWLAGCGGHSNVGPSPSTETLSLKLETTHFRLLADRADASVLQAVADALEANIARVAADLEVSDLRSTTVEVWTDAESYYRRMEATIGRRYTGSSGYVTSPANLSILAGGNAARTATHEFCHCLSLRANPTIANNPRWLWETVALYENGEFVDPRTVSALRSGALPTLAQLNSDFDTSQLVYQVGYVLGEFIVGTWGRDGLVRLVRLNGDVERALETAVPAFEARWHAFLQEKSLG
jgi:hypothetical protein